MIPYIFIYLSSLLISLVKNKRNKYIICSILVILLTVSVAPDYELYEYLFSQVLISPLLSKFTFGSYDYTYSFILLGLFVLFTTITKRQQTVFRGLRQINLILKSGLAGSVLSLIFTLPLFYFYGDKAIVPSLLITSLITLLASQYYYRKLNLQPVDVPNKIVVSEGKEMIKLGIMLIVSILIGMIVKYLIGVGISKMGSIKDVGLYTAATSITAQYIGFILTALSAVNIYKRHFLTESNFLFPVGKYSEDNIFSLETLLKAERFRKINQKLYFYYQREDSISHKKTDEHLKRYYDDIFSNLLKMREITANESAAVKKKINEMIAFFQLLFFLGLFKQQRFSLAKKYVQKMKKNKMWPIMSANRGFKFNLMRQFVNLFFNMIIVK